MESDHAINAHTLTLVFHRLLSEAEWREVVVQARTVPYVKELQADAVYDENAATPEASMTPHPDPKPVQPIVDEPERPERPDQPDRPGRPPRPNQDLPEPERPRPTATPSTAP